MAFFKLLLRKINSFLYSLIVPSNFIDEKTVVGFNTYIGPGVRVTKANIGNYCSIASGVLIGMGEHPISNISTSSCFLESPYDEFTKEDVVIESDVWIGANAVVLRGVTVGVGAVVGANAVVTKNVPPYSVVVGVPAKIIKYRFRADIIEELLSSRWWDRPLNESKFLVTDLRSRLL